MPDLLGPGFDPPVLVCRFLIGPVGLLLCYAREDMVLLVSSIWFWIGVFSVYCVAAMLVFSLDLGAFGFLHIVASLSACWFRFGSSPGLSFAFFSGLVQYFSSILVDVSSSVFRFGFTRFLAGSFLVIKVSLFFACLLLGENDWDGWTRHSASSFRPAMLLSFSLHVGSRFLRLARVSHCLSSGYQSSSRLLYLSVWHLKLFSGSAFDPSRLCCCDFQEFISVSPGGWVLHLMHRLFLPGL